MNSGKPTELRALFGFTKEDSVEKIVLKFTLWSRFFFVKFFKSNPAPFHNEMDKYHAQIYRGDINRFLNIVFRGGSKTTITKIFLAFVIANDFDHSKKYIKVLSRDNKNSTQMVTDIYNMLISPRVAALYPEILQKTATKREETMSSFTTATGVKLTAGTVGSSQRGQIQDESRPDLIVFDDFEDRSTLRSAVITKALWDNMEEARTGLAKDGAAIYLCNYISERGNVHKLVESIEHKLIVPIIKDGVPTWDRYSVEDIEQIRREADDFEGEYLCQPSASKDVLFDRESVDKQVAKEPIKTLAGFRIYKDFVSDHRYAGGADVAGGVGLDSSTSVFIDFDTIPAQVVGTSDNNEIKPETFGDELKRQGDIFGTCLLAPEQNNHGHATIGRLKQIYDNDKLHKTQRKDTVEEYTGKAIEYGWNTNSATKPKMLFAFAKAVEDGLICLNDAALIAECRSYSRNDLMDKDVDVRLTTKHYDLLMAAAIAWQMKDFAEGPRSYTMTGKDDIFNRYELFS